MSDFTHSRFRVKQTGSLQASILFTMSLSNLLHFSVIMSWEQKFFFPFLYFQGSFYSCRREALQDLREVITSKISLFMLKSQDHGLAEFFVIIHLQQIPGGVKMGGHELFIG